MQTLNFSFMKNKSIEINKEPDFSSRVKRSPLFANATLLPPSVLLLVVGLLTPNAGILCVLL